MNQELTVKKFVLKTFAAVILSLAMVALAIPAFSQSSYCKARANNAAPKINFFSLSGGVSQLKFGGCLAKFTFQAYDQDDCYWSNRCLTAEIDFGDGKKYTRNLGCETWTVPHIYKAEGSRTATLKICDPSGKCAQKELTGLNFGKPQPRTTEPAGPSGPSDPPNPFPLISGELLDQKTVLCDPSPKVSSISTPISPTTPTPPTTPKPPISPTNPPSPPSQPSIPSQPNPSTTPTFPATPPSPTTPTIPTPPTTPTIPNPNIPSFDILFVPLNYSDTTQDKNNFNKETNLFKQRILNIDPFSEIKDKINFQDMEPKDCQLKCQSPKYSDNENELMYNPCIAQLVRCSAKIDKSKIDKIFGIIKYNTIKTEVYEPQTNKFIGRFFGQANKIGGQYTVIYPIENHDQFYAKRNTGLHEIGHLFGLYHILVEKIVNGKDICSSALLLNPQYGQRRGVHYCAGPNASDCQDQHSDTDILSYCLVRDHYGPAAKTHIKKEIQKIIK